MKPIRNELAYFYTVIKNWDLKDKVKQSEIEKHEISFEVLLNENLSDAFNLEQDLAEQGLLSWIDLVESDNLYAVLKELSVEDQVFLSLIVKEGKTQKELAKIYGVSYSTVCRRFEKIIKNINEFHLKKRF